MTLGACGSGHGGVGRTRRAVRPADLVHLPQIPAGPGRCRGRRPKRLAAAGGPACVPARSGGLRPGAESEWRYGDLRGVPRHGPGLALGTGGAGGPGSAVGAAAVVLAGAAAKATCAACAAWARLARGAGGSRLRRVLYLGHVRCSGHFDHDVARRVDAVAAVASSAADAARSAVAAGTAAVSGAVTGGAVAAVAALLARTARAAVAALPAGTGLRVDGELGWR